MSPFPVQNFFRGFRFCEYGAKSCGSISIVAMFDGKDVNLVGFREMFALLGKMCYKYLTSVVVVCYN